MRLLFSDLRTTDMAGDGTKGVPESIDNDPSEYLSGQGMPAFARLGLLLASVVVTAAVLVFAIAE